MRLGVLLQRELEPIRCFGAVDYAQNGVVLRLVSLPVGLLAWGAGLYGRPG